MRRTKIICTLGPSSDTPERVRELMQAGMDVARLNFSHGTHETHRRLFGMVRSAAGEAGRNVAILMDLQGPKIRTGPLEGGGPVTLRNGQEFRITTQKVAGSAQRVSTTYQSLPKDVKPGDRILMADGALELTVTAIEGDEVVCRVVDGGELGQHKGINLPGVAVSAPSLTEKDREDLALALELGADYVALSFVRRPEDIRLMRGIIDARGTGTRIVAKIERPEALDCIDEIIRLTDVVMVARGDLGVEVPLDRVPQIQKDLVARCNAAGVPVITATQMLESMMTNPRPTRAEVNDVANAIYDGTDAVMLSGETAAGSFPVRAAELMARIAERADEAIARCDGPLPGQCPALPLQVETYSEAIGHAAYLISRTVGLKRIVCFTSSGFTAQMIARYRPQVPITAFTLTEEARRRCALLWGVEAVQTVEAQGIDEMLEAIDRHLVEDGLARPGDSVVIVAGTPLAVAGRTNLVKLHTIGES